MCARRLLGWCVFDGWNGFCVLRNQLILITSCSGELFEKPPGPFRDQGVAGSNPVIPTMKSRGCGVHGPQPFFRLCPFFPSSGTAATSHPFFSGTNRLWKAPVIIRGSRMCIISGRLPLPLCGVEEDPFCHGSFSASHPNECRCCCGLHQGERSVFPEFAASGKTAPPRARPRAEHLR